MWAGSMRGISRINSKTFEIKSYRFIDTSSRTYLADRIYSMLEDEEGTLWLASYGGLIQFDKKTERYIFHKHIDGDRNSISINRLFCLHLDKRGALWIGTMGGGLNKFDRKTSKFVYYTIENGLPNNIIYSILEDTRQNLWISTNYGITEFNPVEESFINYDVQDGLLSNEFNTGAGFINPLSQEMFFGGMNGFISFFPSEIQQNQKPPPIVFTGFKIQNKLLERELNDHEKIYLKHDENFFSIEFASLDLTNPSKNRYRYILEGVDRNWKETDATRRLAEYTDIKPGTYTFRVVASNNDGIWNKEGIRLHIIIRPPWWSTWWFRISALLLITTMLWSIVYRRVQFIRKRHEAEKKAIELERQALRLQMNPHFIFNSLNSIQSFIVNQAPEKATAYLAKFSRLMRLILYSSREKMVPLLDEIEALEIYLELEQLRFDNKFSYEITCDKEIDQDFIAIPPMLIQPYLENAILHGILHKEEKGTITLSFHQQNNTLLCVIEDDGVGREASQKLRKNSGMRHSPKGMLITDERLQILNRLYSENVYVEIVDLYDQYGRANGTRVIVSTVFEEL
jgi:hypothetical protein